MKFWEDHDQLQTFILLLMPYPLAAGIVMGLLWLLGR
jgi:hypothetical protein